MKVNVKSIIIKKFIQLAKKNSFYPSRAEMASVGISWDKIRHHFGSMTELKEAAKYADEKAFDGIFDDSLFNPSKFKELEKTVKQFKRFVITTAVTGCKVNKAFLKSIDGYCAKNNAHLLVLLSSDPAKFKSIRWKIPTELEKRSIVFDDLSLNSNFFINTVKLSSKQADPITSLDRQSQKEGSFVFASPKQRLQIVATGDSNSSSALMTPGAITNPDYKPRRYMSDRTARIAHTDHVMGAIIVEIENDRIFHFRQIQADKSGAFIDLGRKYSGESVTKVGAEAFVLGDTHAGQMDPGARKAWHEVIDYVGVKNLLHHDLYNGDSIPRHDRHKKVSRAIKARQDRITIEKEMKAVPEVLNDFASKVQRQIVVKSNHDQWLEEYLQEAEYIKDPVNFEYCHSLVSAMFAGQDPLKIAVERAGLKNPEKVTWLTRRSSFKIAGIELAAHGDKGANGARNPGQKALEKAYGNCVTGHSHSPEILRGAWRVGTSSLLELDYNEGASSWMHSSCLVYANGSRQLIHSIRGKWRLK